MITEKHSVVAFDFDDTLVATIENIWEKHKHVASTIFGVQITDNDLRRVWGRPLPAMAEEIYGQPFSSIEPHLLREGPNFPKEIFPGSRPLLAQLRAAGKIISLVTSSNTSIIAMDFAQNAIEDGVFDHVFTIDDCAYHKPDKRVFEPLLAHGYAPNEVVYVGDAPTDFYAARDAGFDFIGVATGLLSTEDFGRLDGWQKSGAIAVSTVGDIVLGSES